MKRILLFLFCLSAFGAGSVNQTVAQLGSPNAAAYVITLSWVGDGSTGSVPATAVTGGSSSQQQAMLQAIQGYTFLTVETAPGSPAPTAGYSMTLTDPSGADLLQGAAATLSSTIPQIWGIPPSSPPLNTTFTLNITGQNVAGAKGSVFIFLQKPNGNIARGGTTGGVTTVPNGGTGTTSLAGILQGHGTSPFTAIALPSDPTKFLDGTGAFSVPGSAGWFIKLHADGITNDRPTIQAASDILAANGGGTIIFPCGQVLLSGSAPDLLNYHGPGTVNLWGCGMSTGGASGTVFLVASSVTTSTDVIHVQPSSVGITGMVIKDLSIQPQSGAPGRYGINIDTTSFYIANMLIDHITIGALSAQAIVLTNPSLTDGFFTSTIRDSVLTNGTKWTPPGGFG